MTITKQVLDRLKCKCVLVTFPVAHAHWYKGPAFKRSKGSIRSGGCNIICVFGSVSISPHARHPWHYKVCAIKPEYID